MLALVLGLILFLGAHSIRIVAEDGRGRLVRRLGEGGYKGVYSILSLAGFVLILYGYGWARAQGGQLFDPPAATRHLALLAVPLALVLVPAAYVPTGRIKVLARHPMLLGVALWSLAHLLANGTAADVVLFAGFLGWSVAAYVSALNRDRCEAIVRHAGGWSGDLAAIAIGLVATLLLLSGLHMAAFGVSPLG